MQHKMSEPPLFCPSSQAFVTISMVIPTGRFSCFVDVFDHGQAQNGKHELVNFQWTTALSILS